MSRYRLSEEAGEDVIAIYIQSHDLFGPAQADRYQDELTALFDKLAAFPGLARLRTELDPPLRAFTYKAHIIFYDAVADGVLIQRVRHAGEDWQGDANPRQDP